MAKTPIEQIIKNLLDYNSEIFEDRLHKLEKIKEKGTIENTFENKYFWNSNNIEEKDSNGDIYKMPGYYTNGEIIKVDGKTIKIIRYEKDGKIYLWQL